MKPIADLFGQTYPKPVKKARNTERGDLLTYFAKEIGKPVGYVAMRLVGFEVKDMYYLKSIMEQSDNTAKVFYGAIKSNPQQPF